VKEDDDVSPGFDDSQRCWTGTAAGGLAGGRKWHCMYEWDTAIDEVPFEREPLGVVCHFVLIESSRLTTVCGVV
jgi:hypothetical protein